MNDAIFKANTSGFSQKLNKSVCVSVAGWGWGRSILQNWLQA